MEFVAVDCYDKDRRIEMVNWSCQDLQCFIFGINRRSDQWIVTRKSRHDAMEELARRINAYPDYFGWDWMQTLNGRIYQLPQSSLVFALSEWERLRQRVRVRADDDEVYAEDLSKSFFSEREREFITENMNKITSCIEMLPNDWYRIGYVYYQTPSIRMDFIHAEIRICSRFAQQKPMVIIPCQDNVQKVINEHMTTIGGSFMVIDRPDLNMRLYRIAYPAMIKPFFYVIYSNNSLYVKRKSVFHRELCKYKVPATLAQARRIMNVIREKKEKWEDWNYVLDFLKWSAEDKAADEKRLEKEMQRRHERKRSEEYREIERYEARQVQKIQAGLYQVPPLQIYMGEAILCLNKITIPDIVSIFCRMFARIMQASRSREDLASRCIYEYGVNKSTNLEERRKSTLSLIDRNKDKFSFLFTYTKTGFVEVSTIVVGKVYLFFAIRKPDFGIVGWISANIPNTKKELPGIKRIIGYRLDEIDSRCCPVMSWKEWTVFAVHPAMVPDEECKSLLWITAIGEGFRTSLPFSYSNNPVVFEEQNGLGYMVEVENEFRYYHAGTYVPIRGSGRKRKR
jgi:hypothetical protein